MKIDVKEQEGMIILTPLIKRLDVTTSEEFTQEVLSISEQQKMIIINLSKINFIDSRGLGSLIYLFKNLSLNGWLGLCEATPNALTLFEMTRMNRLFDIFNSVQEAIQFGISKKVSFDK